jgi:DNA-binding GntR family transcriptional regulator
MSLDDLQRTEPRTLKDNVIDIIRQSIIAGSLAPGLELNQTLIAEKLGVSRGPVREALGQLEQEGLIESTPYKGVIVTRLTRRYVQELYSARAALEVMTAERAVERLESAHLEHLDHVIEEMRTAAKQGEKERLVQLDLHFHEYLIQVADHRLGLKLWKVLEVGVQRCLHIRHEIYTLLDDVVGTHPTLVTALKERNADLAQQLLHEHIAESVAHILSALPPDCEED